MVGVIRVSAAVPLGSRENLVLDRRRIADAVNGVTTRSDSGRKRLAVRVSARKSAQVSTDWRPVPDDVPGGPYWYGYSAGKWECDTLVVSTLALDERACFDEWGTPMSGDMRVEERWQRVGPDKLQLKITVHGPTIYTEPWTSSPLTYTLQHGVELQEIICVPIDENAFSERIRNPADTRAK